MTRIKIPPLFVIEAILLGAAALVPASAGAQTMEKKGTTPYVTHFIFRPIMSIDVPGLGTATNLEAVGTTQNMKGEKMLDKMSAHCAALNVASGDKKYIDGACVLADSDGDKIFSTFDTRDTDKSQPEMNCGTHIITGGTGKYKGITGIEPFACINMPALAGAGGYTAMDIPHNTTWRSSDWLHRVRRASPSSSRACRHTKPIRTRTQRVRNFKTARALGLDMPRILHRPRRRGGRMMDVCSGA